MVEQSGEGGGKERERALCERRQKKSSGLARVIDVTKNSPVVSL